MKILKIVMVGLSVVVLGWFVGCASANQGGGTSGETSPDPAEDGQDVPPAKDVGGDPGGGDVKPDAVASGGPCQTDADCVPAECCHAKTCTTKDNAPDCSDMMCTLDCRGGTMDCGWGKCLCKDGQCAAEINPPPKPPIKADPKMGVKPLPE